VRALVPLLALVAASGCGLTPYGLYDQQPRGVDMAGNTYAVQIAYSEVVEPVELDHMWDHPDVDALFFNVTEQAATAFVLTAAISNGDGEQDLCSPAWEMNAGKWKKGNEFIVQGGHFVIPLGTRDVEFRSIVLEGTVDETNTNWTDLSLVADIDTDELRGGALPQDPAPCQAITSNDGLCFECEGGGNTCTELHTKLIAIRTDIDFDPDADGHGDGC